MVSAFGTKMRTKKTTWPDRGNNRRTCIRELEHKAGQLQARYLERVFNPVWVNSPKLAPCSWYLKYPLLAAVFLGRATSGFSLSTFRNVATLFKRYVLIRQGPSTAVRRTAATNPSSKRVYMEGRPPGRPRTRRSASLHENQIFFPQAVILSEAEAKGDGRAHGQPEAQSKQRPASSKRVNGVTG
jgi:hypothetical protein